MSGRRAAWLVVALAVALSGGAAFSAGGAGGADGAGGAAPERPAFERRPFAPTVGGAPVRAGIAYGPYRRGQRPGGPDPTEAQLLEDLRLLAGRWGMLRLYGATGPAEPVLRLVREQRLPLRVLLGAWIEPETTTAARERNEEQVREAVRLASAYADVVCGVSVGNETQVSWSAHRTAPEVLLRDLRRVRAAIPQPVTTADDYAFWTRPESDRVAAEVDFLLLHAYAMWNRQTLDDAVPWTRATVAAVAAAHPGLPIVLGETGWATERNPDATGDEATQIVAPAGEEQQRVFYRRFVTYAAEAALPYFYFSAFDEPWKGGPDPRGVEKHWGLFDVDRRPKRALRD